MNFWQSIKEMVGASARKLPELYFSRELGENDWRSKYKDDFPIADKMLRIFCEAFDFQDNDRFRFRPDDKVMEVYACLYPHPNLTPDSLEINRLMEGLEKAYYVCFDNTNNRLEKIESFDQIIREIKDAQQGLGAYALPLAAQG